MQKVLKLSNVMKTYPGVKALDDVSFEVTKGSVHGFLGPNGAGKSTAMRIISGLLKADSGNVTIGENLRVGILPEVPPLYLEMTVEGYLLFVFEIQTFSSLSKKEKNLKVEWVMEKSGLLEVKTRLIGNLSKGYKQRVGIASVLVFGPDIILLDEPTSGLDPKSIVEIRNLILELKKDHTIFLSSHRLHELDLICDEVTIINYGKILASGTLKEIKNKFSSKHVIQMEVEGWSNQLSEKIERELEVEVTYLKNSLEVSTSIDKRGDISKFVLENGGVILSMEEKKMELEEIFRSFTEGEIS